MCEILFSMPHFFTKIPFVSKLCLKLVTLGVMFTLNMPPFLHSNEFVSKPCHELGVLGVYINNPYPILRRGKKQLFGGRQAIEYLPARQEAC